MKNFLGPLFERRSAIASSYDLAKAMLDGLRGVSGQSVSESTALNVAAVWTGVHIRSRLLSTLPVDVIEVVDDRHRRPRPNHPAARVLSKPNSWQTRSELLGMLEAHRLLRGNCYAWKQYAQSFPADGSGPFDEVVELIPLHPDQVEVIEPTEPLAPTTYRLHKRNGMSVDLPAREVLHVKGISTNGRTGRSFLHDLRESIGGALATQEHANSLWSRDATPSVVLKHPKALGADGKAKKNIEESWEAIYGRGKDKRRVAVLEEGMEIQQLSLTPEDGQFLQTRQDLRAEIAAALMVPPHMMGLADKATSWGTGIEQQQIGLLTFTLRPDLTTWEERLNRELIAVDKYRIKFNVGAMLRGDTASQFEAFWRGIQMGVYSPNDVRALLDLNPIPDGDVYLQPTNMAPLGTGAKA